MPLSLIKYKLNDGYIDNWLVAGPQIVKVEPSEEEKNYRRFLRDIYQNNFQNESGVTQMPVEQGPLTEGVFKNGDYEDTWSYLKCDEDHLVNHSTQTDTFVFLRSWAYTQIQVRKEKLVMCQVDTSGPITIWLNGNNITKSVSLSTNEITKIEFKAQMQKGSNEILIRFEQVGIGPCQHVFSMRLFESNKPQSPLFDGKVKIPSTIPHIRRRNELEQAFRWGYIKKDIFEAESPIEVFWHDKNYKSAVTHVRLQTPGGQIYAEAEDRGKPGDYAHLGHSLSLPGGNYLARFMPVPREYYEENIRVQRILKFLVIGNHPYTLQPAGTIAERKVDALIQASRYDSTSIFSETAKMASNRWKLVNSKTISETIKFIQESPYRSTKELLGLLGLVLRFGSNENFPKELLPAIQSCVLGFPYQIQFDPNDIENLESENLIRYSCELLAGQSYPENVFTEDGDIGVNHQKRITPFIEECLLQYAQVGFSHWDSDPILADIIMALTYLIDFSASEQIFDLAGALLDKILVGVAINSFKGGLSTSNGFGTTLGIKGALAQAMSGITRLFWGQGIYNHHISGYVSVACLQNYEIPSIIPELALSEENIVGKEKHHDISKCTYRTADFMLSSTQLQNTRIPGKREHTWQATLGVEAVVFTNHPGNASQDDSLVPNYWLGNSTAPCIAQLQDFLISIYNIDKQDRMDFTHAYFPIYAFDEYTIRRNWVFARKNDGYLALTASNKINLIKLGQGAYRELRVQGHNTIWLCQLGSKLTDGDYQLFQTKLLQLPVSFDGLNVKMQTLRGQRVEFGWEHPLLVNNEVVTQDTPHHYDYPAVYAEYPAKQIDVLFGDHLLRLNLGRNGSVTN